MNRLDSALSPYLQQHADNPVDWWPWSPEALEQARSRNLPLMISVGYAACHWCHVMAHESFEDLEVAALINEFTVPVKVDREERPDVDAAYMQATVAMTGQGGWPMTVFATPDGAPFYAGTYFPREHFVHLLRAINEAWTERHDQLLTHGAAVVQACADRDLRPVDVSQVCPVGGPCPPVSPVPAEALGRAAATLLVAVDDDYGGFGGAPKFPTQPALSFLLRHHRRTGEPAALSAVAFTAERMARGGMYDQLAGGFARYSVDATWTVPHFEKMLYDNALLLQTYTELSAIDGSHRALADRIAAETARFLVDRLGTEQGGFAAALDADTDGVEGATYAWILEQFLEVLGPQDGRWAAGIFGVTDSGTFEAGSSVLQLPTDPDDADRFAAVRRQLLAARDARPQPARDDKVVACWNGLAVVALSEFAAAGADREWANAAAERAAVLLREVHLVDRRLRRVSREGAVGAAAGVLEDYAATVSAFLARHRAGGQEWLAAAQSLADTMLELFVDAKGEFTDTARDAERLFTAPTDPADGPTPSGSALAAGALVELSRAIGTETYADQAWRTVAGYAEVIERQPRFAAGLSEVAERMVV